VAREADLGRGGLPARRPQQATEVESTHRGGPLGFFHESYAELKKVEWPTQNQVIQGTVVVLVACAIVGTYLWLNDQLWKRVVQHLI
jgi:preprotein translocase subunit SecE